MKIKINSKYNEYYPPWPYAEQIARYIPTASYTYILLWRLKDRANKILLEKNTITTFLAIDKFKFKRELFKLVGENLVNVNETKHTYAIELVGWDYDPEMDFE
jgi:hypothetical protein